MIKNPIQEVTDKLQSRAIGIIYGSFKPHDQGVINKGKLIDSNGFVIDCVVLGKTLSIIKKHINFEKSYFWIVYPRNKNIETLHIQIAGVWEPFNNYDNKNELVSNPNEKLKSLNLSNNFFSIRGQLIFVNVVQKELVVKILISKKGNKLRNKPFKVTIKGEIPIDFVNSFVSINAKRNGNYLRMDSYDIIENNLGKKI